MRAKLKDLLTSDEQSKVDKDLLDIEVQSLTVKQLSDLFFELRIAFNPNKHQIASAEIIALLTMRAIKANIAIF
jgi:hypothetical protein